MQLIVRTDYSTISSKMNSSSRSKLLFATTAALFASPASCLLISDPQHVVARQTLGRPSFVRLDASADRSKYTELEKLKAKRLSIRRRRVSESAVEEPVNSNDDVHQNRYASKSPETIGLEYLYDAGEERHSDDLFHIILMPS